MDEVFVKVNGQRHYLWRAVDHEGEVLEAVVTKRRNKAAAVKFLKKLLKRHGCANEIVTDRTAQFWFGWQRMIWWLDIVLVQPFKDSSPVVL
ncbi:MAG: DDE-type integrase/transposase/recombinase [Roseibium sp.]